jgi:acyl carrier protein
MNNIEYKIADIISSSIDVQLGMEREWDGKPESILNLSSLPLNSIAFIQILVAIEDEFTIKFNPDEMDFEQYETLDDLCSLVRKKIGG